ncbi:ABC transporter permease [Pseudonocardia kunmingensis]|uniref:Osmoprotectant transport system permease protein n=1 Tax=Pseudonocardia kunmingensis TaxID=630975 RepID=A0A543D9D3_9PSEU|nr:ABC transporter permease [Pseudonocardia kunmingensis]TQM05943.1 osmoprotectant transport system permease protein [Pseudonocardia kunmingensis]
MTIAVAEEVERERRRSLAGYLVTPAVLVGVLVVLAMYVGSRTLDSIEERRVNLDFILPATLEHVTLTVVSTAFVLVIAIPVGILLTRPFARRLAGPAVAVFNIGQAVPSIGVLVLLAIVWGIGFWPAVVALVAYSALPVLRNTMIGLQQVDPAVVESGRGMGMSRTGVLTHIELPLAVPVILTGLRTALVINVGTATLVALTNAGGLGAIIITGLVQNRPLVTVVGSVLVAVLALFIDYLGRVAEDVLRPKGL